MQITCKRKTSIVALTVLQIIAFCLPCALIYVDASVLILKNDSGHDPFQLTPIISAAIITRLILLGSVYLWVLSIIRKKRGRTFFIVAAHLTIAFFSLTIPIYMRYYHSLPSILLFPEIRNLPAISDQIVSTLLLTRDYMVITLLLISLLLSYSSKVAISKRVVALSAIAYGIVSLYHIIQPPRDYKQFIYQFENEEKSVVYGLFPIYSAIVFEEVFRMPHKILKHPGVINPVTHSTQLNIGTMTKNIIVIQVESLDNDLIGKKVSGFEITPFLNTLVEKSLYFPHFYAQHAGGGSSDADFSTLTSILPSKKSAALQYANYTHFTTLPQVLKKRGYHVAGFHANRGSYMSRDRVYPKIGFDTLYERNSFTGEASGWKSIDSAFFDQSISYLNKLPKPFFAYFITMQSHGPFTNFSQSTSRRVMLKGISPKLRDYYESMNDVDNALAHFFTQLRSCEILDSSLIIIHGDHESRAASSNDLGVIENIPLVIFGTEQSGKIPTIGSHIDIAPTICSIIGANPPSMWLGSSLLDSSLVPRKVILSDGSAIRLSRKGKATLMFDSLQANWISYSASLLR